MSSYVGESVLDKTHARVYESSSTFSRCIFIEGYYDAVVDFSVNEREPESQLRADQSRSWLKCALSTRSREE